MYRHHYLSLYRLKRWHMHTHGPSFIYTYAAHILVYTQTYTCTHTAHKRIQAIIYTLNKTLALIHTHTYTLIKTHVYS